MANGQTIQFLIKNRDRVRFYNMQPLYGDLLTAKHSRVIRYQLIDKLSEEQKTQRGITKNAFGIYVCDPSTANLETAVTLNEEDLETFKSWISKLDNERKVYYEDEELFSRIMETFFGR